LAAISRSEAALRMAVCMNFWMLWTSCALVALKGMMERKRQ
jgi:hypothetical protein